MVKSKNGIAFTVTKQYHSKKQVDVWVVRITTTLTPESFKELKERMNVEYEPTSTGNGYYSRYRGVNGFVFYHEPDINILKRVI